MALLSLLILVMVNINITTSSSVSWSTSVIRLTEYKYFDGMPSIAETSDSRIWIVWARDIQGNLTLFYKFSDNLGDDWSHAENLTKELAPGQNSNPSMFQAMDGTIWVVWQSNRPPPPPPPEPDFTLDASPNNLTIPQGSSDNSTIIVTSLNNFSDTVSLSVSFEPSGVTTTLDPEQVTPPPNGTANSTLTVSVDATAEPGNYTLTVTGKSKDKKHMVNIDLEIISSEETTSSQTSSQTLLFSLSSSSSSTETTEVDEEDYEIYYKTSKDDGATWSDDIQITDNTYEDMGPSAIQLENGTIMVVWESDQTGNPDIFYTTTLDGLSWSDAKPIVTDPGLDKSPSVIQAKDNRIWVVWCSNRTGNFEIFYKTYNGTWSNENNLTNSSNSDSSPTILQTLDGTIWIFWSSREDTAKATHDIYYKFSLDNGETWSESLQFTTNEYDDVWPAATQSHDTKIWVVWVSNRGDQPDGNWDIYYRTSLPGDVNNDGIVNNSDLEIVAKAFGCSKGEEGYNEDADLNSDGVIDVIELAIVGRYYGET
jgi:hypothetical protein